MKTKKMMRPIAMAACMLALVEAHAQTSVLGNNPGTPGTDYVGWDNSTTVPLMIRHNANQPIQWFTDAVRRMQLYQTLPAISLNGFTGLNHSGYLGLSGNPAFFNTSLPFSRLHLADTTAAPIINAQQFGFRPWQRNGITFTGNGDHGYFGQEHNGRDTTDMVLSWSNDFGSGQFSPDHLSIRFLSNHTGAASGASSLKGLEAMRFFPVDRDRVHVGIGDWFAGNLANPNVTEPAEMLDVLTGRVRIRQLPLEDPMDSTSKVVVVNEDGVLGWLDASGVVPAELAWLTLGNTNIVAGTHFLGTTNGAPVDLRTDSVHRARLLPDANYDIGDFTGLDKSGRLLLSPNVEQFYSENGPGPFSLLHLAAAQNNAQQFSYRDWMDVGVTLTGNDDHSYIGQKGKALDFTDMVVHWSDNPSKFRKDRMRFIFTSGYNAGSPTGASSYEGLEAMRMYPVNDTSVFIGIGDWYAANVNSAGAIIEPEERVDVVDGRVRIRQLPTDPEADTLNKYVVVDEAGVLHWRSQAPGGADCDWIVGEAPNEPHVSTAHSSSGCDWDQRHGVAIGRPLPKYKLDVYHDNVDLLDPIAIYGDTRVPPDGLTDIVGVMGMAAQSTDEPAVTWSVGVRGGGHRGLINLGVQGYGYMDGSDPGTANVVGGVMGIASAANNANAAIGVYGTASGAPLEAAGYFDGDIYVNGEGFATVNWTVSDAQFKTNVNDLSDATERIMQLRPKTYDFVQSGSSTLRFPPEHQSGFLAHELGSVLPWAVRTAVFPGAIDVSTGTVSAPTELKVVNYSALIPVLVAGMQEQQAQIVAEQASNASLTLAMDELRARLDQLEQLVLQCCGRPDGSRNGADLETQPVDPGTERLLRIDPNPFTDRTNIRYTLERGGRMLLLVNSSDGKQLQVLQEGAQQAGEYQQEWLTSQLAPGIYYVTLLLDGEPLVKRAVKVQ